jgi:hypothetical protein
MRIKLIAATITGALACATLGAAVATASSDDPDKVEVAAPDRGAVPTAKAPNARAAGLVSLDGVFVRQKGFLKVTHPSTGFYCLKLNSTINEGTLVASVAPEGSFSTSPNATARWISSHAACPLKGNWVEVITFLDQQSGTYTFINEGFSIIVP